MTHRFADLTFTDGVKAAQDHYGSLTHNKRLQENFGPNDQLTQRETDFIAQRDTFYLATVSDYQITLNPDLEVELKVIDEKVEIELALVHQ